MKNITCFVPYQSEQQVQTTLQNLSKQPLVAEVHQIKGDIRSTENVRFMAAHSHTPYTLIYTKFTTLSFVLFALERMEALMEDTGAAMVYSDHFNQTGSIRTNAPVIDYQIGVTTLISARYFCTAHQLCRRLSAGWMSPMSMPDCTTCD